MIRVKIIFISRIEKIHIRINICGYWLRTFLSMVEVKTENPGLHEIGVFKKSSHRLAV